MATNFHIDSAPCAFLATPLDADCKLTENAPMWVLDGVATWTPTPTTEDGLDLTRRNWAGARSGPTQIGARSESNWAIEGSFTGTDWRMFAAMAGHTEVLDGLGNTVGIQRELQRGGIYCGENGKPRFALAIAVGVAVSDAGCVEPVDGATRIKVQFWPLVTNIEVDLAPFEGEASMVPFTMQAYGSPDSNAGVANLYPATDTPDFILPGKVQAETFIDPASLPTVDNYDTQPHPVPRVPV